MSKCPVCDFESDEPIEELMNHGICPCCGTEFGYDDFAKSHAQLRQEWMADGAPWFSEFEGPPPGWIPPSA